MNALMWFSFGSLFGTAITIAALSISRVGGRDLRDG
jgi:hypothetical protein